MTKRIPSLPQAVGEGAGDVVAVADEGHGFVGERAEVFLDGHEVGHGLAGMAVVGKAIDHGDARVLRQLQHLFVLKSPGHDAVAHSGQNARDVFDGFAHAETHLLIAQQQPLPAEMRHCYGEAHARAQARLLEDHRQRLAIQNRIVAALGLVLLFEPRGRHPAGAAAPPGSSLRWK